MDCHATLTSVVVIQYLASVVASCSVDQDLISQSSNSFVQADAGSYAMLLLQLLLLTVQACIYTCVKQTLKSIGLCSMPLNGLS